MKNFIEFRDTLTESKPLESVSPMTEDFLKKVKNLMKSKGYSYKMYKQSSSVEWEFTKGDASYTLGGWYGKGRSIIFDIFKSIGGNIKRVESLMVMPGNSGSEDGAGMPEFNLKKHDLSDEEFKAYSLNVKEAYKYLEKNA